MNIIDNFCNYILKKRDFKFHLLLTIITSFMWPIFYFLIKVLYIYSKKDGKKCSYCNYVAKKNDSYCPKCGKLLEISEKEAKENEEWLKKHGITISSYSVSGVNPYKNAVPKEVYQFAYSDKKSKTYPNDYVVFDTETTGLEPEIDKIIEISAIKYINGEPISYFSELVNPKINLDPYITKLTGIKDADLLNKPTIDEILPHFFDFIGNDVLVAHNAPFDIKMIACEAYRNKLAMCNNRLIDTIPLAKKMIPEAQINNYKLSTLKNYFGINIRSHRALEDCEMCNIIYQKYLKFSKIQNKKILVVDEETGEILQESR